MTKLEEAILEVYQTESERDNDTVTYPFANPYSTRDLIARVQRGAYIASLD